MYYKINVYSMNEKITINVYMIRHGMSETNAMQKKGIIGWIKHLFKRDPCLVKEGIDKSKKKGKWLNYIQNFRNDNNYDSFKFIDYSTCNLIPPHFDFVLCSELLRAIETAVNMFQHKKIYVIPYVSEIQGYKNVIPLEKNIQQDFIYAKYPRSNVDWKYIDKKTKPNYKKFKEFLQSFINENKKKDTNEYNIALVTHSLYMMKYAITPAEYNCNCCYLWRIKVPKPKNNSIFKITI